ncbi:MAG TPA: glycosyltransferase [Methylomirabilota bacterium]|nr:glycosyltransferase [Methylomirabilota bacterium]
MKLRRIFCLVPDCHSSSGHYNTLWRNHFELGVAGVVERVVFPVGLHFDWARSDFPQLSENLVSRARAEQSEKLRAQIFAAHSEHGLDAVLSYCYGRDVEQGLVTECISRGIPWINFFCDSTHQFEHVETIARVASLNWFPEHAATRTYQALGRKFVCLPYAVNPDFMPDCTTERAERSAAFIGLPTTNRVQQLGILLWLGIPLEIRGRGWDARTQFHNPVPKWRRLAQIARAGNFGEKLLRRAVWKRVESAFRGPLPDAELQSYLRKTRVLLGLNQGRDRSGVYESYLKFRDIEFPGYGCCYVTQANADTTRLFARDEEIVLYDGIWDAHKKIDLLLRNPDRAKEIGKRARQRVLREHTWQRRIAQLAEAL